MNSTPHPPAEEQITLIGPGGALEARLRPIAGSQSPRLAAVLCHPHPLHGGAMTNKLLYRIAKRLPAEVQIPALRFNFRGVGASEGHFDHGIGETDDVAAAFAWMGARFPQVPLALIGYSFGAAVGLAAAARHPRVAKAIGIGLPLALEFDLDFLDDFAPPLLLVHGENDEFASGSQIEEFARNLSRPADTVIVSGTGHLFTDREDDAADAVVSWLAG